MRAKLLLGNQSNNRLIINQLPQGITLLKENKLDDDNVIYYFGKKIDVTDYRVHMSDSGSEIKKRRYRFRQNLKLWKLLFSCDDELTYTNHGITIKTSFLPHIDTFSNLLNQDEIYFPVAFLNQERPTGGAYIYLWTCNKDTHKNYLPEADNYLPVAVFHTGACMFGSTLYGIDEKNQKYSLTDPKVTIPETCMIEHIQIDHELHPDELLSRQSFINLIPWIKTLSKTIKPIIKHQIPLPNYIIYGIAQYLKGTLSKQALKVYVRAIKSRAKKHEFELTQIANQYDIDIQFISTLQCLNLDQFHEDTLVEDLLKLVNVDFNTNHKESLSDAIPLLFNGITNYLSSQPNHIGELWRIVKKSHQNYSLINKTDLLQLNYIDYSATLALCKKIANGNNVCSIMPSHEKHIALGYKNIFSEKLAGILCASYLPAFHISIAKYNHAVFYLTNHIDEICSLLQTDLIKLSSLQTAATALNSIELSEHTLVSLISLLSNGDKTTMRI